MSEEVNELVVNGRKIVKRKNFASPLRVFWKSIGNMDDDELVERHFELQMNTKQLGALDGDIQKNKEEKVMRGLKNGKSTGLDGILYEMYKNGGIKVVDILVKLFNAVWRDERVPKKWNIRWT